MATTNRSGPATEPVLPSSRQPVPGSEQYTRPTPAQRDGAGDDDDRSKRRTAAEIEAEIDATTERLSATVDELVDRLSPARIANRGVAKAKGLVTGPDGSPRAEIVGAVVGALVGAAFLVWRSRR